MSLIIRPNQWAHFNEYILFEYKEIMDNFFVKKIIILLIKSKD